MKVKCDYCDNYYDAETTQCPHCGAPNAHIRRTAPEVPHTIAELSLWADEHHIPLEKMHVHIGEDYRGARAYGIYRENGKTIVYKNDSHGNRKIRYEGTDEAYAVGELYAKIREMTGAAKASAEGKAGSQKNASATRSARVSASSNATSHGSRRKPRRRRHINSVITISVIFYIVIIAVSILTSFGSMVSRNVYRNTHSADGYYIYDDNTYYRYGDDWYIYNDNLNGWRYGYFPDDDWEDYYSGSYYDSSYGTSDFYDSDYYDGSYGSSYDSYSYYDSYSSDSYWDDDDWDYDWDDDWDDGWDWDDDWDWDSDW